MKPSDIDSIEIEGARVTIRNKDGWAIGSTVYESNKRAMEIAAELWRKKVKSMI